MSKSNVKNAKKQPHREKTNAVNPAACIAVSIAIGTAVLFISAAVFAFILQKSSDPTKLMPAAAIAVSVLTGAVSGATVSKTMHGAVPWALVTGVAMLLIYFIISMFFDSAQADNNIVFSAVNSVCLIAASLIFGTLSVKKKSKKKVR